MDEALMLLASAWPQPLTKEGALVYAEFLADVPAGELRKAIRSLIVTSKWRPSVAEIRRAVLDGRDLLPSGEEAMEGAEALDEWYYRASVALGAGREPEKPPVHPTVEAAWNAAGPGSLPAVFIRCWREERDVFVARALGQRLDGPLELGG